MKEKIEKKFGLGVTVYVFNRDFSKILLLKINEEKRNRNKADWGNVGGRIELGEKLVNACPREAKEEIGVDLKPKEIKLIKVKETPYLTNIFHAIHFIYATIINEDEKIIPNFNGNHESDEYKWFKLTNLPCKTLDKREEIIEIANKAKRLFRMEINMKQAINILLSLDKKTDKIRKKYDLYSSKFKPHITLVYPFEFLDQETLISHIKNSIKGIKPFKISLEKIGESFSFVQLIAKEGVKELLSLREKLNDKILKDIGEKTPLKYPTICQ